MTVFVSMTAKAEDLCLIKEHLGPLADFLKQLFLIFEFPVNNVTSGFSKTPTSVEPSPETTVGFSHTQGLNDKAGIYVIKHTRQKFLLLLKNSFRVILNCLFY